MEGAIQLIQTNDDGHILKRPRQLELGLVFGESIVRGGTLQEYS
jgi:hypothetical protein